MHAVNGTSLSITLNGHETRKTYFECEEKDLSTQDFTEVARHVVANQYVVRPEPLVRTRKEPTGARQYRPRPSR